MVVFQPASLHSAARSEYLVFFRSKAASIPSSHGTVSSMRSAVFSLVDHTTMSGRRDVVVISLGNWSCLPRSTRMLHSWSEQKSFGVCFGLVLLLPPPSLTKLLWCSTVSPGGDKLQHRCCYEPVCMCVCVCVCVCAPPVCAFACTGDAWASTMEYVCLYVCACVCVCPCLYACLCVI